MLYVTRSSSSSGEAIHRRRGPQVGNERECLCRRSARVNRAESDEDCQRSGRNGARKRERQATGTRRSGWKEGKGEDRRGKGDGERETNVRRIRLYAYCASVARVCVHAREEANPRRATRERARRIYDRCRTYVLSRKKLSNHCQI